jgi:uncharacterized phage-like protein YoqJ
MIIAATGHRPDKLGRYKLPNPTYTYVCQETKKLLLQLKPDKCISGMALGFDQYFAMVCIRLGIPFIAAVPFEGQESVWPEQSKRAYHFLLKKASEVVIVSEGGYLASKLQARNEYMIDRADQVIAAFDGSSGGTKNCVEYARSKNKVIHIIDPKEVK